MENIGPHPDFPSFQVFADRDRDCCQTHPYPSTTDLAEYYRSNYRVVRKESPSSDYVTFMFLRACVQRDFVLKHSEKAKFQNVLDIGSGCGTLINALKEISDTRVGYEPDEVMVEFASRQFGDDTTRFFNKLFDFNSDSTRFDLITMSHVLEHVPHPGEFLDNLRIHSLLPGGSLFIEVPNDPLFWVEKQIQWRLRGMAHLTYFTPKSLRTSLRDSGFKILGERVCGLDLQHEIAIRRPLNRIERGIRKVRRFFKPDPVGYGPPPDYSAATPLNGVYLQVLATC